MKSNIYINDYHIISPLGNGIDENWTNLIQNQTGIEQTTYKNTQIPLGKIKNYVPSKADYTVLENLVIDSLSALFKNASFNYTNEDFLLVISTTKGNIDLLKNQQNIPIERSRLGIMASAIKDYFKLAHQPIIISNACVSGVMATTFAKRYLENHLYNHILVCGVDVLSEFVIDGFLSFKAISHELCKPFDKDRLGINIGESVASILLSRENISGNDIYISGTASSNDANHISGPSRTGDGLAISIKEALNEANISLNDINFISAHGTATLYNDEMESKALESLMMNQIPINSFKSYIGHTLGAAGIIEIIFTILCMKNNLLIKSLGFESTDSTINVINENQTAEIIHSLKLSSGFGGCNAVITLSK